MFNQLLTYPWGHNARTYDAGYLQLQQYAAAQNREIEAFYQQEAQRKMSGVYGADISMFPKSSSEPDIDSLGPLKYLQARKKQWLKGV